MNEGTPIDTEPSWDYVLDIILESSHPQLKEKWEGELRKMAKACNLVRQAQKNNATIRFFEDGSMKKIEEKEYLEYSSEEY